MLYIQGETYYITPQIVEDAFDSGEVQPDDEQEVKGWIHRFTSKKAVKEVGDNLFSVGQAKWQSKRRKFSR